MTINKGLNKTHKKQTHIFLKEKTLIIHINRGSKNIGNSLNKMKLWLQLKYKLKKKKILSVLQIYKKFQKLNSRKLMKITTKGQGQQVRNLQGSK